MPHSIPSIRSTFAQTPPKSHNAHNIRTVKDLALQLQTHGTIKANGLWHGSGAMVFTPCLILSSELDLDGTPPKAYQDKPASSFVARCGDPKLYTEASETYYRVNKFWHTIREIPFTPTTPARNSLCRKFAVSNYPALDSFPTNPTPAKHFSLLVLNFQSTNFPHISQTQTFQTQHSEPHFSNPHFRMATASSSIFKKFPTELREQIFTPCLLFSPTQYINGVPLKVYQEQPAPALLAALRGDPELYSEALEIYYRVNTFWLTVRTQSGFLKLNANAVACIKKLVISFLATSISQTLIEEASPQLNLVVDVEELWMNLSGICRLRLFDLTKDCPFIWSRIRFLEVKIAVFVGMDPQGKRGIKLAELESTLGKNAVSKVSSGDALWSNVAWTWGVRKGSVLVELE